MKWILTSAEASREDRSRIGGKGHALALLAGNGFRIPETLCLTVDTYNDFVDRSGLRERILLELYRKDFQDMRWEEIWDCATRIRNMFLKTPMPPEVESRLRQEISVRFEDRPAVVRSSAPEEDNARASFAGLHESYLNINGTDSILDHIRKVWASLWSDAALLYRQEIGLDVEKSSMAVVIQEIITGDRSGVAFSRSPNESTQAVVECVYGLNQGLVDGQVEPDRWILDRQRKTVVSHTPAVRRDRMVPRLGGVELAPLPDALATKTPLDTDEVMQVFEAAQKAEDFFESPQDVEWTFLDEALYILQSRPITTLADAKSGDNRSWYLSLHRSFENLKSLRNRIEHELIPAMITAADEMAAIELPALSDQALAAEINNRWNINHKWSNIYWEEFIPFAHGVRLFGQVYNDVMHPDDAYEFVDLLTQTDMASLERNQMLEDLADRVRGNHRLAEQLRAGDHSKFDADFLAAVDTFISKYGDLSCAVTGGTECVQDAMPLFNILLELAAHPVAPSDMRKSSNAEKLREKFLNQFETEQQNWANELLDLARVSYQLRDDDNIYLGRIEARLLAAIREGRNRIDRQALSNTSEPVSFELKKVLDDLDHRPEFNKPYQTEPGQTFEVKPRQLLGQPAGPGIAKGRARVILQHTDLADFKSGEILICDAVDPNMTFVVPLAAAVVERRGGMLIHGAIIAREYGLPCVTGIPEATALIETGDQIYVDGYLGLVTLGGTEI
ncbi:MAG: PEP/pyruvate-binding domain-containing protein [Desulfobacterales bacterium]|nr:PEP/pyruvate-binding domain-containing protein [Desulfobacterales bacterium]